MASDAVSNRQAIVFLIASVLTTLLLFFSGVFLWQKWQNSRLLNPNNAITAIVQTGPEKEALSSAYLAELLDLSRDRPTPLYGFDLKRGEQKLLSCPLIAAAKIKRLPPSALYIDYTVRKPIALIADYQNTAIDREGFLFPLSPFFTPKNLPEIYLGIVPFGEEQGGHWQTPLSNKPLRLAFDLIRLLADASWRQGVRITRIDVSNAFANSLGKREIVLFTEEELDHEKTTYRFPKILRLSPKDYPQQLNNFFALQQKIFEDYCHQIKNLPATPAPLVQFTPRIIDLRIPQTAFVQNS